jgi:hypothetical protein
MCSTAISLTSKALGDIHNAEVLVQIKAVFALFIQTMEVWITPPPRRKILTLCCRDGATRFLGLMTF